MNDSNKDKLQILELFGGIGAPRCAYRNLGVPVKSIDYVEVDERTVRSYNAMFANELRYHTQDIRGWNLRPDVLVHGSPCQDFSIAGRQQGADEGSGTRSSLMWETLRIIRNLGEWKPRVVIWENVTNVLSRHMRHNFDKYLTAMRAMGYTNTYDTLNAMDFGLPQARKRVFTVSILHGAPFSFDRLEHTPMRPIGQFLEHTDEPQYKVTQPSILSRIGVRSKTGFRGDIPVITDHVMTIATKQMRCPNSGVLETSPGCYRYLTERECWRLQGFTDNDFNAALKANPGKPHRMNGTLYKQAGNSMPVPILESIFKQLQTIR